MKVVGQVAGLVLLVASAASAQQVSNIAYGIDRSRSDSFRTSVQLQGFFRQTASARYGQSRLSVADSASHEGRVVSIIVGGLIGAAVLGGWSAIELAHCDDCILAGPFIYAATGVGAILGGLGGWLIYRTRH